mgnify:CR=1 FL=1
MKIKAVLDTNVIISALIGGGVTGRVVTLWKEKKVIPLICKQTADELLRVLAYPKFHLSREEIQVLFERHFLAYAEPVTVSKVLPVIEADSTDDIFLACALAGHAKFLVSGDHHLLDLGKYKTILIITVREFLSKFY